MTRKEFRGLLRTVADGWNARDARTAAEYFTEDAVYVEPPDRQRYVGRQQLADSFGRGVEFSMTWHRIAFDEEGNDLDVPVVLVEPRYEVYVPGLPPDASSVSRPRGGAIPGGRRVSNAPAGA